MAGERRQVVRNGSNRALAWLTLASVVGAVASPCVAQSREEMVREMLERARAAGAANAAQVAAPDPGAMAPDDAAPGDGGPPGAAGAAGAATLTPDDVAALREQYDALSEPERAEMRAYYADMGIDLDAALGISAARAAEAAKGAAITMAMREMNFARTPQAVLSARAELGFGRVPHPNPATAPPQDVARWIHLHVMAGEWATLAQYLGSRPAAESEAIYATVLQSVNRGDAGLLPEEVLAFAEACPGEPKEWQMKAFGAMLASAASKHGAQEMLACIADGTRLFGAQTPETRRRTVEFLAAGGLVVDAYDYLSPLDEARAASDAPIVLIHGRYKQELASLAVEGPQADALRLEAWDLFAETALMPRASAESRREALRLAIGAMDRAPRSKTHPWLTRVFASDTLGPVALEIMAITAVSIGDSQLDVEQRAQSVVTLKEAVDILLAREGIDSTTLRVPLRMLTSALVAEMESAVAKAAQSRNITREAQLLLRAAPGRVWLDAIEPALATRASKASIAVATLADETDMALALLDDAVRRTPDEAAGLGDHFLRSWEARLRPKTPDFDDEMYWYYYQYTPAAPLTRGRQRRNLDRLDRLLTILSEIGVEPRSLPAVVPTFQACHARTEVYDRADIVRVFGEIDEIPPSTAASLAASMSASLNGDWRNRTAQRTTGTKRSDTEIALLVDKGYGLAIELAESALAREPETWRYSVLRAALTYDRMQFQHSQGKVTDPARRLEYQRAAFDAFAAAADRYAGAVATGAERDDITIYLRWFGAAMGAAELSVLRIDDLPTEGSVQHDEVDRIAAAMRALPADAFDRHAAEFARAAQSAVAGAAPEIKPKLVKHALRVVGDHPAAASLQAMDELYRDLVKEEIRLRVALDGDDRVGVGEPFGVLISLRFTNSVDRETGGFSKYLQNGVWGRRGNSYGQINYRDDLEKAIRGALSDRFSVEAMGFFAPYMPPRGVVEDGQDGWLEKPLVYVVLTRQDPEIDRLPQIVFDMQFSDQAGPVTLALPSNTPLLALGEEASTRPVQDLTVSQAIDLREVVAPDGSGRATLEVRMRGKGVVPDVRGALAGLSDAFPGYVIHEDGIEAHPPIVLQSGDLASGQFGWGAPAEPEEGYPEPDEHGMYRLPIERSFTVSYTPDASAGARGNEFRVPTLREGVAATLQTSRYTDLDLEPVSTATVAVDPRGWPRTWWIVALSMVFVLGAAAAWLFTRRRVAPVGAEADAWAPSRLTPLSVVTSLRRLHEQGSASMNEAQRAALLRDIREVELKHFGPGGGPESNGDLASVVDRWSRVNV